MTAEELAKRFDMQIHAENGSFCECHYIHEGEGRARSGSIYYYVGPTERTKFHRIDCDEYWNYVEGSTLEICLLQENGEMTMRKLGVEAGAEPLIYVPKGTIFASRHARPVTEGTFITCITVPRFTYDGFTLISDEDMLTKYPQVALFLEPTTLNEDGSASE